MKMYDKTFSGKTLVLIIVFLQDSRPTFDTSYIHNNEAMWVSTHYLSGPIEAVFNARVVLPT